MLDAIKEVQPLISLIIGGATLLGIAFAVYRFSNDPAVKAASDIDLMKQKCNLLHGEINSDIKNIKENHLKHIERDISNLKIGQSKIFTILDERLPNKK
ncbi:MAG TPA: hypothetical protein VMV86_02970 [Methanosarcinales archaeon]|nr:hypothetical protein [Methanosarcinales archaeon]